MFQWWEIPIQPWISEAVKSNTNARTGPKCKEGLKKCWVMMVKPGDHLGVYKSKWTLIRLYRVALRKYNISFCPIFSWNFQDSNESIEKSKSWYESEKFPNIRLKNILKYFKRSDIVMERVLLFPLWNFISYHLSLPIFVCNLRLIQVKRSQARRKGEPCGMKWPAQKIESCLKAI